MRKAFKKVLKYQFSVMIPEFLRLKGLTNKEKFIPKFNWLSMKQTECHLFYLLILA